MFIFRKPSAFSFLIVGLGNPGKQYAYSRHNVGFRMMDALADHYGIRVARSKFNALVGDGKIGAAHVVLLKPLTFMNLSGSSVRSAMDYYKLDASHVLVLYDDVDLAPGVIRIRAEGSAGGHNGVKSLIDYMDTQSFLRVKIGVGAKPNPSMDLADWVLAMPSSSDKKAIEARTDDILSAVELIVNNNLTLAQSRYNG